MIHRVVSELRTEFLITLVTMIIMEKKKSFQWVWMEVITTEG